MKITVKGPRAEVLPQALGGPAGSLIRSWFEYSKGQDGIRSWVKNGVQIFEIDPLVASAPKEALLLCLGSGFEVHGAAWYIVMPPSLYATQVIEGMNHRIKEDEAVRVWSEWHDDNHNHMETPTGDMIVPGNSWGEELTFDEVKALFEAHFDLILGLDVAGKMAEQTPAPVGRWVYVNCTVSQFNARAAQAPFTTKATCVQPSGVTTACWVMWFDDYTASAASVWQPAHVTETEPTWLNSMQSTAAWFA